ncbi:hypothetical protein GBA52_010254 [Prunus armeniaca]|nr:hypothetical protein GBA52_010254 [Prunus armeniaca]
MSYILWNCQRLGPNLTVRTLRGLVRKFWPTVVFLMETKSKDNKIESLKRSCGFQKGTLVGSVEGLSLWWDDNIDLEVKGFSKKFIDTSITGLRGYMECHIERRMRLAGTFSKVSSNIPTFHGYAVVISTKSYGLLRKGVVLSSLPTDPATFTTSWRRRGSLIWVTRDRASLRGLTCRMVCLFRKGSIEFWGTYHGRSHGQILPSVTTRPSVRITIHWSWRKPCIIEIIEGSSSLKLIGPMRWRLNRLLKKAGKSKFKVRGYINGKLSFIIALPSFKNEQRKVLKQ